MSGGTRLLKPGLALALLTVLAACATTKPDTTPVEISRRLAFSGYSIVPPLGPGWERKNAPGTDVVFEHAGLAPGSRVLLVATAEPAPRRYAGIRQFLDDMIEREENEAEPRRFHVLQESTSLAPEVGQYCVRTSASAEDRASPGKPVLDATRLTCLHPTSPGWMISVTYTELHPRGVPSPDLVAEGERFIGSLHFFDRI